MEEIGLEEARKNLGEIVEQARVGREPTMITRHGKPAAVVVNAGWHERTLADLEHFMPQPMSQNCRDGKHGGSSGEPCVNCWCLCHWGDDNGPWGRGVARAQCSQGHAHDPDASKDGQ